MLALIQREVVDRKGWIDEEEFLNMIALAQAAPGLIAVNSAIFIGWRIGGSVVALIAAPLVKLARNAMKRPTPVKGGELRNAAPLLISLAAALAIWLGHVNPVWVILITIVCSICSCFFRSLR